jgi:hypothetical protein
MYFVVNISSKNLISGKFWIFVTSITTCLKNLSFRKRLSYQRMYNLYRRQSSPWHHLKSSLIMDSEAFMWLSAGILSSTIFFRGELERDSFIGLFFRVYIIKSVPTFCRTASRLHFLATSSWVTGKIFKNCSLKHFLMFAEYTECR